MNNCHSKINQFPIDYNLFPLAEKCKMYSIELEKNESIFIPSLWFHWIFTEPNTLSVHYRIDNVNFNDKNTYFYQSLIRNEPFISKSIPDNYNITYNDFINNSLDFSFRSIISLTEDCIPVKKNNITKFFHKNTLKNLLEISKQKYHIYIGQQKIDDSNILSKYKNIDYIINPNYYKNINYDSSVWFSLDKRVNSGLHNDPYHSLIYVIEGKKTIHLFNPDCHKDLYITNYNLIKYI
jgi:hypothetical protein